MTEIKFKISEDVPSELIKFLIESELNIKIAKIKRIKEEIQLISLKEEDINLFEKARQEAWNDLKEKQKL